MKIVREAKRVEETRYEHFYEYEGCPGAGFGFPCRKDGRLLPLKNDMARQNLGLCRRGVVDGHKVIDRGVKRYTSARKSPRVGKCECGQLVELDRFTNTCACGRDYNSCGQRLAPRSQWGQETGESVTDILAIDSMTPEQLLG